MGEVLGADNGDFKQQELCGYRVSLVGPLKEQFRSVTSGNLHRWQALLQSLPFFEP